MSFTNGDSTTGAAITGGDNSGSEINVNSMTLALALAGAQASSSAIPISGGGNAANPNGQTFVDTAGYDSITAQVTLFGTGVSSVTVQASNDGVNFGNIVCVSLNNITNSPTTSLSTFNAMYVVLNGARYYRFLIASTQTGSSTTIAVCLKAAPSVIQQFTASNSSNAIGGLQAMSNGGASTYSNTSLSNTPVTVKSAIANVFGYHIDNPNAAWSYVQFFNTTTVTLGTTTPFMVIGIAPQMFVDIMSPMGKAFSSAVAIAATTTPTGSTAPATSPLNVTVSYS